MKLDPETAAAALITAIQDALEAMLNTPTPASVAEVMDLLAGAGLTGLRSALPDEQVDSADLIAEVERALLLLSNTSRTGPAPLAEALRAARPAELKPATHEAPARLQ